MGFFSRKKQGAAGKANQAHRAQGRRAVKDTPPDPNSTAADFVTDFTMPLLGALQPEGTAVCSSLLAHELLTALLLGARGNTAQEMLNVLMGEQAAGMEGSRDNLVTSMSSLWLHLMQLCRRLEHSKLHLAAAMWIDQGFPQPDPDFLKHITDDFKTSCDRAPLRSDPDGSVQVVNDWAAKHTAGLIKEILQNGDIDTSSVLVLANALHFKGNWMSKFDKANTREADFDTRSWFGSKSKVQMMSMGNASMPHSRSEVGGQPVASVLLPYKDDQLGMLIVLPDKGVPLPKVESAFNADALRMVLGSMRSGKVNLQMPKFKIETDIMDLGAALQQMGVKQLFNGGSGTAGADLSGIFPAPPLYVSTMVQKAVINVDEEGSEAAAAAAAVVRERSISFPMDFVADRPFLFCILEQSSGCPLMLGRYCGEKKKK